MSRNSIVSLVLAVACAESAAPAGGGPGPGPGPTALVVGADISFLPEIESQGGTYADAGGAQDLLLLMREHGFTAIRLRLWHTPAGPGSTLDQVKAMAARVHAAGMDVLLDIHYSDSWADPGKQTKPAAWDALAPEVLLDSVYRYSRDVVAALVAQGTTPAMVQIGNEISAGLLWPDGRVGGPYDTPAQWDRLVALLDTARAGILAAAGAPPPAIVIHFDNGANNGTCRWFFDHLVARALDFDAIGVSYYPSWHGTLSALQSNLADLGTRFGKDVYVVETAYPWTLDWADTTNNIFGTAAALHPGYPATVDGQGAFVRAVAAAVRGVPGDRRRGVFYWAPEWISVPGAPSAWENATLFDFDGRALASLDALAQATLAITAAPTPAPSAVATQP